MKVFVLYYAYPDMDTEVISIHKSMPGAIDARNARCADEYEQNLHWISEKELQE